MVLAANDMYGHGSLERLAERSPSTVQLHLQKKIENQAWRFVDRFEIDDTLGHQEHRVGYDGSDSSIGLRLEVDEILA